MALDELQGVIENLRDMIETHHSYLSAGANRSVIARVGLGGIRSGGGST